MNTSIYGTQVITDSIRVFNKALTEKEIDAMYNSYRSKAYMFGRSIRKLFIKKVKADTCGSNR